MHQIVGGNAFNTTMNPLNDIGNEADCTTCTFSEDFSNYWTAVLYFQARNGSFKRVPQLSNQNLENADGGMTVYYISPDNKTSPITAFKKVSSPLHHPCTKDVDKIRASACSLGPPNSAPIVQDS